MSGLIAAAIALQTRLQAAIADAVVIDDQLTGVGVHLEPSDAIETATRTNVAQVLIAAPTYTRGGVLEGHVDVTWSVTVLTRRVPRVVDAWRRLDAVIDVIDDADGVDVVRAQPGQVNNTDGDPLPAYVLTLDPTIV